MFARNTLLINFCVTLIKQLESIKLCLSAAAARTHTANRSKGSGSILLSHVHPVNARRSRCSTPKYSCQTIINQFSIISSPNPREASVCSRFHAEPVPQRTVTTTTTITTTTMTTRTASTKMTSPPTVTNCPRVVRRRPPPRPSPPELRRQRQPASRSGAATRTTVICLDSESIVPGINCFRIFCCFPQHRRVIPVHGVVPARMGRAF